MVGELFAKVVADLLRDESPVDESLALVVTGRAPWRTEVSSAGASVSMRAIPLTEGGQRVGALLLLRDVSELRRRERELLTKEATIREIHHRVKNNLQTVAALLRLQARRLPEGEGRTALEEAVRRVGVIALVHETLSQGFDERVEFDEIASRGLNAVVEVARGEHPVHAHIAGRFGQLRAEDATALAMIMSELIQNAAEHGLAEIGGNGRGLGAAHRRRRERRAARGDDHRRRDGPARRLQRRGARGWAPRSCSPSCRTCGGGSRGKQQSRAERGCGSWRGFGL